MHIHSLATKRIWGRALLISLGLLVGLALCEAWLALRDKGYLSSLCRRAPRYHEDPQHLRFALLGGSTARGEPYSAQANFTLLTPVHFFLAERYGLTNVAVDVYAAGGFTATQTAGRYWKSAEFKPDVMVLYTGQNEFSCSYSPNMQSLPNWLRPIGGLRIGRLLLHRLYVRELDVDDRKYRGRFYTDNVIPSYELSFNRARFQREIEDLLQHCRRYDILPILIVPEGNWTCPPVRSIYRGPAARKEEALRLYKQAFHYNHFEEDRRQAQTILEELLEFCGFADLYYDLGMIHLGRGELEDAGLFLRRAHDTDGLPDLIPSEYREMLIEITDKYDVPHIDMRALIADEFGVAVPDYSVFVDSCHLQLKVYEALSREIIKVLRREKPQTFDFPAGSPTVLPREWPDTLGITDDVLRQCRAHAVRWHSAMADYSFLKVRRLRRALRELLELKKVVGPDSDWINETETFLRSGLQAEEERIRSWISEDVPTPGRVTR